MSGFEYGTFGTKVEVTPTATVRTALFHSTSCGPYPSMQSSGLLCCLKKTPIGICNLNVCWLYLWHCVHMAMFFGYVVLFSEECGCGRSLVLQLYPGPVLCTSVPDTCGNSVTITESCVGTCWDCHSVLIHQLLLRPWNSDLLQDVKSSRKEKCIC